MLYEVPGGRGPALGRVASVAADGVQVEKLEEDVANQVRTLGYASQVLLFRASQRSSAAKLHTGLLEY